MSVPSKNARDIFVAAVKLPPEQWDAYLVEACGEEDALQGRVRNLLAAHAEARSFLESPAGNLVATQDQPFAERTGTVIGPYKLMEQIGEGGMGVVFVAEQYQPIRRKVALKLIKPGMDTREVITRFEAERQALALMDHPHIARVLDAGATASGRPYFVMELVKGVPITQFCDDNRLTPRARLDLFVSVCQAVQHAHQKGIIHRDIKPSNVLVTSHDGRPVVKVIDFGVAKAVGQQLTEKTIYTGLTQMVGTPLYMSPEQAGMSGLDIDTRTDIYSLGVLLYELLTGTTPFDKERLMQAAYEEMRRIIREEEPPKPSTRLSDLGRSAEPGRSGEPSGSNAPSGPARLGGPDTSLASISAQRHMEPAKLSKLMRGELDWIVMKTLEKDRNRRYETANGLAADLQRYLTDEPVLACPPSAGYRFRKFARRNRVALLTIAAVVVTLVAGTLVSTWQAIRATHAEGLAHERFQAEQQARHEADANLQKAREAGEEFFARVSESRLLDEPGLQPLRKELLEAAATYYERLAIREGDDPRALTDLALSQLRLAQIYMHTGFGDRHIAALEEGIKRAEKLISEHPDAADHHLRLAGFWHGGRSVGGGGQAQTDERAALRVYQNSAELWEKLCQRYPNVVGFQNDLSKFYDCQACTYEVLGHLDEAVRTENRVCEIRERIVRAQPGIYEHVAELAHTCVYLAQLLETTDPQAAEDLFRRGLDLQKDAPDVATYQEFLAGQQRVFGAFLARRDRPEEAIAAYRQAVDVYQKLLARFPHVTSYREALNAWQGEINILLVRSGKGQEIDRGEELLVKAIDLLNGLTTDDAPAALFAAAKLYRQAGDARRAEKQTDKAVGAYETTIRAFDKLAAEYPTAPEYRAQLADSYGVLAQTLRDAGQLSAAQQAEHNELALSEQLVVDFPTDARHRLALARRYYTEGLRLHMSGRHQDAESANRKSLEHSRRLVVEFPDDEIYRFELAVSHFHLGLAHRGGGRLEHAEQSLRRAVEILEKLAGESRTSKHSRVLGVVCVDLATVLLAAERPQEAETAFRQSLSLLEDSDPQANWLWRMGSHAYLSAILKTSGRAHEAEEQLGKLLELAPNADKQNEFVWLLVTSPDWPSDAASLAVELAKGTIEKAPNEGKYWTTLGAAHYRAGEWKSAIDALEKSRELRQGGDSHDGLFLAMAHWQLGDKEQARKHYDRAAQWMEKNRPQDKELRRYHAEAAELLGLPEPPKGGDVPSKG